MKRIIRPLSALLVLLCLLQLAGCGSDYPLVNRKLDISSLINSCFDGTGYNVNLSETEIIVSAVGDRMSVNMEESDKAVSAIRESVRNAVAADDGLTGAWTGSVNISPVVCESFESIEGLNLEDSIGEIMLTMTLTFTDDGFYIIKFQKDELDEIDEEITEKSAKAAKEYLGNTGSIGKVVMRAITDDMLENVISYVVSIVHQMLSNGAAGTYAVNGNKIKFDDNFSYDIILTESNFTLSGSGGEGMLKCFESKPVNFAKN